MFGSNASQVSNDAVYVEDVFSTYLYTGNDTPRSIPNGIDLAGKGGLVWIKGRSTALNNILVSETPYFLVSNTTAARVSDSTKVSSFNANGFSIGNDGSVNNNNTTFVSWTFREQPKFFDVVTFSTGASTNTNLRVSHSLGSVPGCMMLKRTDGAGDWIVWHRSLASATNSSLNLNLTAAVTTRTNTWGTSGPTSTDFGIDNTYFGTSATYVAYLFAHDAGGFGTAGTDNVISCGSFTTDASGVASVTLGYEPQWLMIKRTVDSGLGGDWYIQDSMRLWATHPNGTYYLRANDASAELGGAAVLTYPTATGFVFNQNNAVFNSKNFIYIAIRRGPMKTPTTGASVFEPAFATANSPEYKSNTVISGFDTALTIYRPGYSDANFSFPYTAARLTGSGQILQTSRTNAEYTYSTAANFAYNTGWFNSTFGNDTNRESYMFKRAPGFHDVVCYTGTGVNATYNHNLGVVPELMILKNRSTVSGWLVYAAPLGATKYLVLNAINAEATAAVFNNTAPTSTQFSIYSAFNNNAENYVNYLFASCPGVSKVGSYSGTGATQTISCGFAARFVLIKRTDSTGDWWVWDTTRGMVAGTDPRIPLNSAVAETNADWVYTNASGFQIVTTDASVNANGGSYIYLAIA